jgi:hypothetical protein
MTTSRSQDQVEFTDQAEGEYVDLAGEGGAGPGTIPSGDTLEADRRDAIIHGHADRMPTAGEEAAAPDHVDPSAAGAYEEALERGARVKGEGQI